MITNMFLSKSNMHVYAHSWSPAKSIYIGNKLLFSVLLSKLISIFISLLFDVLVASFYPYSFVILSFLFVDLLWGIAIIAIIFTQKGVLSKNELHG